MSKKLIWLVAVILLLPFLVFAQEKPKREPATRLEQFLSKKGKLIVKDFHDVGRVSGQYGTKIEIDALIIYEPGKESEKIRGLRIDVEEGGRVERSDTSFLDMDEVESLSQAISYMIGLLDKWKSNPSEYTEVIFSTRGDFGKYSVNTLVRGIFRRVLTPKLDPV